MATNPLTINTGIAATNANAPVSDYKSLISADVSAENNGLWDRMNQAAATNSNTDVKTIDTGYPVEANSTYA